MTRRAAPEMTSEEIALWRSLVMERCGLFFTDSRLYFLAQRLWERVQVHQLADYQAYYRYLVLSRHGQQEWLLLLEQLVNNETRFFRHKPSFAALRELVVPQLWREKQDLAVWSVGCSAGQEAYSLAMLLLEQGLFAPTCVEIVGSDISVGKLRQAENGRYQSFEISSLPSPYREKYVRPNGMHHDIEAAVRQLVRFTYLNLQTDAAYSIVRQDIIFCQNVLIYFKNEMRPTIVQRLADCLNPGGYLFLAPTDIVGLKLPQLRPVQFPDALIYQRVNK